MYKLKKLPYKYYKLEPFIDTHTLGLHYLKHAKSYLDKLNSLLIKNNFNFNYELEELSFHINELNFEDKDDILFNLGGVINHNIYFESMSNKKEEANIFLKQQIIDDFKSLDNFKKEFKDNALKLKGSGYTYLVIDKNKLKIMNFKNQDTPYFHNLIPLIAIDLWEHAYYLNYENNKSEYIDNFFEIMNFEKANKVFIAKMN